MQVLEIPVRSYLTFRFGAQQAALLIPAIYSVAEDIDMPAKAMREAISKYNVSYIFGYDGRKSENLRVILAMLRVVKQYTAEAKASEELAEVEVEVSSDKLTTVSLAEYSEVVEVVPTLESDQAYIDHLSQCYPDITNVRQLWDVGKVVLPKNTNAKALVAIVVVYLWRYCPYDGLKTQRRYYNPGLGSRTSTTTEVNNTTTALAYANWLRSVAGNTANLPLSPLSPEVMISQRYPSVPMSEIQAVADECRNVHRERLGRPAGKEALFSMLYHYHYHYYESVYSEMMKKP